MFKIIKDYQNSVQYRRVQGRAEEVVKEVKVFTCTIGRQPSQAQYCLYTLEDVQELLSGMSLQVTSHTLSVITQ
jgi:hypothetical protein